jgi:unsaturated rhamnogalacturonyl hydrolase
MSPVFHKEDADIIEKVKLAMLSNQRDAWEQGVAAQALLELGEIDLVVLLAREAVLRQRPDGRLAIIRDTDAVTDPAASGEAVLFAARMTGEPVFKQAADRMLAYLLDKAPRTRDGVLHHIDSRPELWIDAAYMAPPFLALAGRPDEAVRQIEGYRKYLWDTQKKLFSHVWDDGRQIFIRRDFWGVGNGWAAAGMARIIRALPAEMAGERQNLIGYVHEVIDGCLVYQRADGLFHDVVDNPASFVETNLAQMLAYTIFRGLRSGWVEESYRVFADRMRAAAHSKVDEYGFVQGVCGSPNFDHPGTATEGQAFFLLMEAAFHDL